MAEHRRGTYEGRISADGSVQGRYFEETLEEETWDFVGRRVQ